MVDTIFADVAQPDQARIVAINAHNFLKNGGHFVISIKVLVLNFGLNRIYIQKSISYLQFQSSDGQIYYQLSFYMTQVFSPWKPIRQFNPVTLRRISFKRSTLSQIR